MPNTGKPSQDCHLCRRRRVKCDLTRPQCNRCIKYGTECPGYRTQQELVFRNATPATSKKKKKRSNPSCDISESASPAAQTSGAVTPSTVEDVVRVFPDPDDEFPRSWTEHTAVAPVSISRSLNQHWTQHSVPILLNVYSELDFLHNTYRTHDRNGPLTWAAHLFSRTYVTNLRNPTAVHNDSTDETDKLLGMYMGKTLTAVSEALSKPDGAFRDDVLATVWILANYEVLVGSLDRVEPMSPWHLHAKGMYSILQARGVESIKSENGRTAFWPTYNMIQLQALLANTEAPVESELWLRTVEEHLFPGEGLTLYVAQFITKVCAFQARAIKYIRTRDFAGMSDFYREGWHMMTSAENELNGWIDTQPPFEHELDPYMRNLQYSAIVKGYHIMQMMCNMLTHYAPCPIPLDELLTHRRFCLQTIRIASQGILSNIPYAIGPLARGKDKSPRVLFDALKLIWPLLCIYMVSTTTQEQKKTAWTTLKFIGEEVGVRQATKVYSNMMLLPPEALKPLDVEGADLQWVAAPEVNVDYSKMN